MILSNSPTRGQDDLQIIWHQNEKFKQKFPKACKKMELDLKKFIDINKDLSKIDYCQLDPAARFIHNQIIEVAKLCLEKSIKNELTCTFFDEMTNSLETLLSEAKRKCQVDLSFQKLRKFVNRLLLNVSRVARLLECLEFDPLEFFILLNQVEQKAKIKSDIPKYILTKLGLNRDLYSEFAATVNANNEQNKSPIKKRLETTESLNRLLFAPVEKDFEKIKLISNGAYG